MWWLTQGVSLASRGWLMKERAHEALDTFFIRCMCEKATKAFGEEAKSARRALNPKKREIHLV
jgi:hypothetical protein